MRVEDFDTATCKKCGERLTWEEPEIVDGPRSQGPVALAFCCGGQYQAVPTEYLIEVDWYE